MHLRILLLLCGLFAATVCAAGSPAAVRRQAESSLQVTGDIDISADGKVVGYTLDMPEKLPKGIVDMVARIASQWTFEPIALDGKAVSRSRMTLQFVAKKQQDGTLTVALRSGSFDDPSPESRPSIDKRSFRMPNYPLTALQGAMVPGVVYLVVRYDRAGTLVDVDAERVDLRAIGSEAQMTRWRDALARSALSAAKGWKLVVPDGTLPQGETYGVGRIPVAYTVDENDTMGRPPYGRWETYIPGPQKLIPWWDTTPMAATAPDTLAPGAFHDSSSGRRLLTPLDGG